MEGFYVVDPGELEMNIRKIVLESSNEPLTFQKHLNNRRRREVLSLTTCLWADPLKPVLIPHSSYQVFVLSALRKHYDPPAAGDRHDRMGQ
jgi:hypothetical protein